MYSARHYKDLLEIIAGLYGEVEGKTSPPRAVLQELVEIMADRFKRDNDNFSYAKFNEYWDKITN